MFGHLANQPANTRLLVRHIYAGFPSTVYRWENGGVNPLSLCAGNGGKRKRSRSAIRARGRPHGCTTENLCVNLLKSRRPLSYRPRVGFRPNPEKTTVGQTCHIPRELPQARILPLGWRLPLACFRPRA